MKSLNLTLLILLGAIYGQAFAFKLDAQVGSQDKVLESFLIETQNLLPEQFKTDLNAEIIVKWEGKSDLVLPGCERESSNEIFGSTKRSGKKYIIGLHSGFKAVLNAGLDKAATYECGHKNTYQLAKATLLHELAHVWDLEKETSKTQNFDDVFFRTQKSGKLKNKYFKRSPDPYEFKNRQEQFAVNFEYFILDPQYVCRRPLNHNFFKRVLNVSSPNQDCPQRIQVTSFYGKDLSFEISDIARIDYLLASKAQGASRFGHSMILLVICKNKAENCSPDKGRSIVVSFRAQVNGPVINTFKGIVGKYPSQIFAYSYAEVIDEYTRKEMRNLEAYPLQLNAEEREEFLRAFHQYVWEYQGAYKFLSNNCATETLDLFRASLYSKSDKLMSKGLFATPYGVLRILTRAGLLNSENAKLDKDSSVSNRIILAKDLGLLKTKKLVDPKIKLNDYLVDDALIQLAQDWPTLTASFSTEDKTTLTGSLLRLTLASIGKLDVEIDTVKSKWLGKNKDSRAMEIYEQVKVLASSVSPYQAAQAGYGIPYESEYGALKMDREVLKQVIALQDELQTEYDKNVVGLTDMKATRALLKQLIEERARDF